MQKRLKRAGILLLRHVPPILLLDALRRFGCPFYQLFGVRCPGCGLTRAWRCCLCGQWSDAFGYHALFLLAPCYCLLFVHRDLLPQRFRRPTDVFLWLSTGSLLLYHLLRSVL